MGQWDDIRELWGDALAPVPVDLISPQASELTRRVLSTVGLPTESPLGVFYHDERLRTPVVVAGRSYLAIGDDHGSLFGIDVETDQLHNVFPATPSYNRFVNSHVSLFLSCYGLLCSRLPQLRAAARSGGAEELAARLEREISEADQPALADGRSWWSLVVDMAHEGEL